MHCGQTVGRIKMNLGTLVGLSLGHTVLDGDPAPPPPKGHSPPIFGPYFCGQMSAWIKISLGMELGLGPGYFVLDGDPAPLSLPKRGSGAPKFSAHVYCGQTVAISSTAELLLLLRIWYGWLVGWGLTALLTQNRSYRACRFVGIFYSKL